MIKLFSQADIINNQTNKYHCNDYDVAKQMCKIYPNIPLDIMQYFFVRHSSSGETVLRDVVSMDANKIVVNKISLTNKQLQDKSIIDFAPFANYGEPYIINDEHTINFYKSDYFKTGTWLAPIIAIRQSDKLLVLDGTNRFRHMLNCLFNKFDFINASHEIYVLEESKNYIEI